jgi:hypothetical protein
VVSKPEDDYCRALGSVIIINFKRISSITHWEFDNPQDTYMLTAAKA